MPASEGVAAIASDQALLREARAIEPVLRSEASRPAGRAGVMQVIGRREALFPPTQLSPAAKVQWWEDYADALMDIPIASLEGAMKEWIRSPQGRFMPKPGELLELARCIPSRPAEACRRAREAIREAEAQAGRPRNRVDPEQVRAMMTGFRLDMARRRDDAFADRMREPSDR